MKLASTKCIVNPLVAMIIALALLLGACVPVTASGVVAPAATAASAMQVASVFETPVPTLGSQLLNGRLYFAHGNKETHFDELWISDGTEGCPCRSN